MEKINFVNNSTPALNSTNLNKLQDNFEEALENKINKQYTLSDNETYSCNYINQNNIYSTSETLTGKTWIDGKPIYRKVFEGQLGTAITHNIINANFINIYGFYIGSSGNVFPLPSVRPNYLQYACGIYVNSTQISFDVGSSLSNLNCYIVLEYTKTTD